jgi:hypothetical protein
VTVAREPPVTIRHDWQPFGAKRGAFRRRRGFFAIPRGLASQPAMTSTAFFCTSSNAAAVLRPLSAVDQSTAARRRSDLSNLGDSFCSGRLPHRLELALAEVVSNTSSELTLTQLGLADDVTALMQAIGIQEAACLRSVAWGRPIRLMLRAAPRLKSDIDDPLDKVPGRGAQGGSGDPIRQPRPHRQSRARVVVWLDIAPCARQRVATLAL